MRRHLLSTCFIGAQDIGIGAGKYEGSMSGVGPVHKERWSLDDARSGFGRSGARLPVRRKHPDVAFLLGAGSPDHALGGRCRGGQVGGEPVTGQFGGSTQRPWLLEQVSRTGHHRHHGFA